VIPFTYEQVSIFQEGMAAAKVNGKWGYIDKTGTWKIEPQFSIARPFSSNMAAVSIGDKWGFINKAGKVVLDVKYDWAESFMEGTATLKQGDLYALIDVNLKFLTSFEFGSIWPRIGGRAIAANADDMYGVIDNKGKWILAPTFSNLGTRVSDGLIAAEKDGIWGFINLRGEWVLKPQFEYAFNFMDGLAKVKMVLANYEAAYGYVDKKGTMYWDPSNVKPSQPESKDEDDWSWRP
jgi:hypothetical protein